MDREMKPIVRWKSISLRGMLLLIVAIALLLGWIANKARQQREAVAALQKFGGFVHYDWEFKNGRVKVPRDNKRKWSISICAPGTSATMASQSLASSRI
jgi:hypothetical protein